MKQFLYMDTDIVNSIIAQSENGIIMQKSTEYENNESHENELKAEASGKVTAGGSFFKLAKAEADLSASIGLSSNKEESITQKDIVTKTLHDAAFDIAVDEIHCDDCDENEYSQNDIGKYIKINRKFDFVDLDYLDNMFSEKGFIDFLKRSAKEKIEGEFDAQLTTNLTKNQVKAQRTEINSKKKELIKQSEKEYDDVHEILSIIKQIIPYSKMLISNDGYLIPMENKYFRVDPSSIGFRYGGTLSCVGMISNIVDDANEQNSGNVISSLQLMVNKALNSVFQSNSNKLCIIHPIGIYYGN